MTAYQEELRVALAATARAADLVRAHYQRGPVTADAKADGTPVTAADLDSNQAIVAALRDAFPGDGILAEESGDDATRLGRQRVWIVNPLDGTRDFVARTGEFAIHIALAVDGAPALAVVCSPIERRTYQAVAGQGAFELLAGGPRRLHTSEATDVTRFRIGVSRLGVNDNLQRFVAGSPLGARAVAVGASLKMLALARGDLEASLCLTRCEREWDTCAPELIVREAGGRFSDLDGAAFRYNKPDIRHLRGILASNGPRHDELLALVRPYFA